MAYKRHHGERMELVWKALHNRTRTLYEIIGDVIHEVPDGDMFLAISEILVHLETLIEEGKAELVDPGPPALYHSLLAPSKNASENLDLFAERE